MDPNERGSTNMERAKMFLRLTPDESEAVSRLAVPERQAGEGKSFYDAFALAGMRVVRVEPGLVVCSFKVPPRLTDRSGNLANGAIANLVDVVGISLEYGRARDHLKKIRKKRRLYRNGCSFEKQNNRGDYC
ncbi:unnamed protein product [Malus baccata var. baccata]